MLIDFQVIPHKKQRYPTVGDWWFDPFLGLHIRVSILSEPRHELLVFVHELMEALICREAGVTQEQVDDWDKNYEVCRDPKAEASFMTCGCRITALSEPGNDIHAPYHGAHHLATVVEKLFASVIGVSWVKYNAEVEAL